VIADDPVLRRHAAHDPVTPIDHRAADAPIERGR
jgi:hypothetical protein